MYIRVSRSGAALAQPHARPPPTPSSPPPPPPVARPPPPPTPVVAGPPMRRRTCRCCRPHPFHFRAPPQREEVGQALVRPPAVLFTRGSMKGGWVVRPRAARGGGWPSKAAASRARHVGDTPLPVGGRPWPRVGWSPVSCCGFARQTAAAAAGPAACRHFQQRVEWSNASGAPRRRCRLAAPRGVLSACVRFFRRGVRPFRPS